jgi:hypothetical protein
MEAWRQRAHELFPDILAELKPDDSQYALWFELWSAFCNAYESNDRALIKKIYQFADWCMDLPRGETSKDDPFTCVCVCFYEELLTNPATLQDMPNWLTRDHVEGDREIFSYKVGTEGYKKILAIYDEAYKKTKDSRLKPGHRQSST